MQDLGSVQVSQSWELTIIERLKRAKACLVDEYNYQPQVTPSTVLLLHYLTGPVICQVFSHKILSSCREVT